MIQRSRIAGNWIVSAGFAGLVAGAALVVVAQDSGPPPQADTEAARDALAPLQAYIGEWRGVGQVRRGSNQGAWREQAAWVWDFAAEQPALVLTVDDGKFISTARLSPGKEPDQFQLTLPKTESLAEAEYEGTLAEDGRLIFDLADPADERPDRLTLRQVADGDRLIVLFERRLAGSDRYVRLGEVGYTREGSSFGKGATGPECVVTGGQGSIKVRHAGRDYYVCCSGCQDLFESDPEGVLADFAARQAEKAAEKKDPAAKKARAK